MHFTLSTLATLLIATIAVAAPTEKVARQCSAANYVAPSLLVPVDSAQPSLVYGTSSAFTAWKTPSDRRMLVQFQPGSAWGCALKLIFPATGGASIKPNTSINVYTTNDFTANTSWNSRPAHGSLVATQPVTLQSGAATTVYLNSFACQPHMNYEIEVASNGQSISFTEDVAKGVGIVMTKNC